MIVRNEERVLGRCLESVLKAGPVDCWAIVDTGSTDGTLRVIEDRLGHLPGALMQSPWTDDFGAHREQAAVLARDRFPWAGWHVLIDADEILIVLNRPGVALDCDMGVATVQNAGCLDARPFLLRSDRFRWEGVRHEEPVWIGSGQPKIIDLPDIVIDARPADGGRTQAGDKFAGDARALSRHLQTHPEDARAWWYLGVSLSQINRREEAFGAFCQRSRMGGDRYQVWFSLQAMGIASDDPRDRINFLREAWKFWHRAETAGRLALAYLAARQFDTALGWAELLQDLEQPVGSIEWAWYGWRRLDILFRCLWCVGRREEALKVGRDLTQRPDLPSSELLKLIAKLAQGAQEAS
jgi:glycosyltransferase involved in cell wall biosynthesis